MDRREDDLRRAAPRKRPQNRSAGEESQTQWSRILWLDRQIRERRYPNAQALVDEFSISRRTAFNTIDFLRWSLQAPAEYDRAKKGYYYPDPTYALPAVFLKEGELLAVLLAEEVTRQYLGTPLEEPLRHAVGKIARYLPETVRVELEGIAASFHVAGGSSVEVPFARMQDVLKAIRERRVLAIRYYTPRRHDVTEREIEPHFLENVRGDWMVVAWDRLRQEPRTFMLSRMEACEVREERFRSRPELSPAVYAQHTFLWEHGAEPYEVVLQFDAYLARWIRERTWHPSQQLEDLEDGGVRMRLTISGEGDLVRWILQHGSRVEILEPQWLRERIAAELHQAAARYSAPRVDPGG